MTDEHADLTNERADETFRELQNELTIMPSPEFAAKVRARLAAAPARGWFGGWRVAAASVFVLAGVGTAGVIWGRGGSGPKVVLTSGGERTMPPAVMVGPAIVPIVTAVRQSPTKAGIVLARAVSRSEPEVIVPPDERIALLRVLGAIKAGRPSVPVAESVVDETTGELKPLAAIAVAPIVVEPLSTAANSGGSVRRDR